MNKESVLAAKAVDAWIGLGANLGDAKATLKEALAALSQHPQIELKATSSFYSSAPVDAEGPDFINAAAHVKTTLSPLELLLVMQKIELDFGRERPYYHAPRTLDLDLLLYGEITMQSTELTLPHPAMHERAFVLAPLTELDERLMVAGKGRVSDLLAQINDQPIRRL